MSLGSGAHELPPSDELLARYLSGECLPAEREGIERWIAADPAREQLVRQMRLAWEAPAAALAGWDAEAMQSRMLARLEGARVPVTPLRRRATHILPGEQRRPWRILGAAVSVAATVALAAGLGVRGERAREAARVAAAAVDSSRFSTRPGQRATVTLTDGSTVTLGAESRLSVAPRFGEGRRVVVLEGDAFFDVARDSSAPFIVVANGAETRVLGTAFAVRGGRGEPEVSVAVVRGRVGIGSGDQSRVLGVGDVGRTAADGTTRVRHDPLEVAALTSWKDGWLTLVDAPVDEAAAAIGRWYDLDVQVPDARLRSRRISASFHDEPAAAVLRSVGEVLDARVERSGNTVTIHSR